MIFSITVFYRDRYVLVGISEEELFRSVMGDKQFDQAVQDAYYKDEERRRLEEDVKPLQPRFKLFR